MRQVLKSSELSIVRVDRRQKIQKFEESNFKIFSRDRVESILAIDAGKDTGREIKISLNHELEESKVRVGGTREM
jgi:hypothetical protein